MRTVYVVDALRTPRGRGKPGKGGLSSVHPQELLATVLRAMVERTGVAKEIDDVVVGCVSEVNEQGANIARNAVLAAGLPDGVTGVTLNRFCGSGLQAVNFAALGVRVAGGEDISGRFTPVTGPCRDPGFSIRPMVRAFLQGKQRPEDWSVPTETGWRCHLDDPLPEVAILFRRLSRTLRRAPADAIRV